MNNEALIDLATLTAPYTFVPIVSAAHEHAKAGKWAEAVFAAKYALNHPTVMKMRNFYRLLAKWQQRYGEIARAA